MGKLANCLVLTTTLMGDPSLVVKPSIISGTLFIDIIFVGLTLNAFFGLYAYLFIVASSTSIYRS